MKNDLPEDAASVPVAARVIENVQLLRSRGEKASLTGASLFVFVVAVLQTVLYVPAEIGLNNSGLSASLQEAFRAQWIAYAIEMYFIASLLLFAVLRPQWVTQATVILSAVLCLLEAAVAFYFHESMLTYLLIAAAALCIIASILRVSRH